MWTVCQLPHQALEITAIIVQTLLTRSCSIPAYPSFIFLQMPERASAVISSSRKWGGSTSSAHQLSLKGRWESSSFQGLGIPWPWQVCMYLSDKSLRPRGLFIRLLGASDTAVPSMEAMCGHLGLDVISLKASGDSLGCCGLEFG